jgi:hypothetical protein
MSAKRIRLLGRCWSIVLLSCCLISQVASATTIVIIRTHNMVVIASDSKAQYQGDQGSPQVCKIAKQNETYFVVAGLVHDTYHGFLANRTVASAIARGTTFEEQANAVAVDLQQELEKELSVLRADDPDGFKFAVTGDVPSSIALVAVEGGVPKVVVFSFVIDKASGKLTVVRDSCPGSCPGEDFIVQMGRAFSSQEVAKVTGPPTRIARTLVEMQIGKDPQNVGPPIEVLELRAAGPEWIQDDLNCAAETNTRKKYPHSVIVNF